MQKRLKTTCKSAVAVSILLLASAACNAMTEQAGVPSAGGDIYVSISSGNNSNPGTKEQPMKNIDKALAKASSGDRIHVAEGVYSGTFGIGYLETDKAVQLYGGYSKDFSKRDVLRHPTLFQPDNASGAKSRKALLRFTKDIDGAIVDGFIFDMGMRNAYHPQEGKPEGLETGRLLLPTERAVDQNSTVTEPIISIPSAANGGNVIIRNNVFLNGASFAIQAGIRSGGIKILNNVFVANRMAAIEVYGTCPNTGGPKSMSNCGSAEIAYNTILFSWSRLKDMLDMGYGVRVMTKLSYDIHHNIIGGNILGGVDHTRFTPNDRVKVDNNIFFVNKKGDMQFSPASNTTLFIGAEEFGDVGLASASGNVNEIPKTLPVDKDYLAGYLSARYSEQTDLDRNSPANQWRSILGMNLVGTMQSSASMFANRYPWRKAAELFGAVSGQGAQTVK